MDFEQRVKNKYDDLSENEKEMVFFIRSNVTKVVNSSIIELAEELLSSKSSVLRLAKKLGYHGFSDMKYSLENSLNASVYEPTDLMANLENDITKTFQYVQQTNFQPILDKIFQANNIIAALYKF